MSKTSLRQERQGGKGGAAMRVMKQQTLDVSWTLLTFCESRTPYMFFPSDGTVIWGRQ